MIKAIIFDGGGTIWDSMEVLFNSYIWAFEELGLTKKDEFPFSQDQGNKIASLKDFNTENTKAKAFIALFLEKMNPDDLLKSDDPNREFINLVKNAEGNHRDFKQLSERLSELLLKYLYEIFDDTKYPLCKNIKDTLQTLKEKGIQMAMVSNRRKESTMNILNSHDITSFFTEIITWEDQTRPKPSPEGIETAMKRMDLNLDTTIFVGDSEVDILSGKSAGLMTIGVLSGMADRPILEKANADIVIDDVSKIFDLDMLKSA